MINISENDFEAGLGKAPPKIGNVKHATYQARRQRPKDTINRPTPGLPTASTAPTAAGAAVPPISAPCPINKSLDVCVLSIIVISAGRVRLHASNRLRSTVDHLHLDILDPIFFCRCEMLRKSPITQIPPGKHACKSRAIRIPPCKHDIYRVGPTKHGVYLPTNT